MSKVDCKVVLLGSANAGKTSLLQRYIHGTFSAHTQTTVAGSYAARKHQVGKLEIVLACWDTAGSERYATMSRLYYRKARAAILCFDLTDRSTYDRARHWVSELLSTEEGCKIYFCGTKKDLAVDNPSLRSVKENEANTLAADLQGSYFETSSKTGENVEEMFVRIASDFADKAASSSSNVDHSNNINNKTDTLSRDVLSVSWRTDRRVAREKSSSCCLKH